MAPELVIADAAYKTYPGGIIVLRAADWLGPARGTLSTEADARSCCGTVVRDTQQVASSVYDTWAVLDPSAFQDAEDTLVIDLATLPVEVGLRYHVLVSVLIEGDWDPTNYDTTHGGTQSQFGGGCDFRWYGDVLFPDDTFTSGLTPKYRGLGSYRISAFPASESTGDIVGDEVLHFRAYSQSGTTSEWLIDQVYLIPRYGTTGSWTSNDFEMVAGQHSSFGFLDLTDGSYVDGADGGDINGKFTWAPVVRVESTELSQADGGGDYQKDDTEYVARVIGNDGFDDGDFYYLVNSQAGVFGDGSDEVNAHAYGLHGPYYVPARTWVEDDFSRTVGDGNFAGADDHFDLNEHLGYTPEGFGWGASGMIGPLGPPTNRSGRVAWVDGSEACMEIRGFNIDPAHVIAFLHPSGDILDGASMSVADEDGINMSGLVRVDLVEAFSGGSSVAAVGTGHGLDANSPNNLYYIQFDIVAKSWGLVHVAESPGSVGAAFVFGPVDISSYWSLGTQLGFRLEIRRFVIRVKVWEASGGEPGTWDYEDFKPLNRLGTGLKDYDYDDDLRYTVQRQPETVILYHRDAATTGVVRVCWDDIKVEYDPGGDNESAWASIEQPEGNEVGRIEMPAGCQHLVYWGTRDWTEYITGDGPYIDFSAKVWNDAGAAELQRAEAVWWWFRSIHAGIVSMNWRRAQRKSTSHRVLTGR